ncbi:MAG: transglycosylase SLT domain-containing protein [Alphaproteobacteria bacterium]|nr:transglycosylase SLT domain-containing protein [Alphaproteobacteria bacterium]
MSNQERWDVVIRVLSGPLSLQGEMVCRGPVVRMGANPGPGGLNLSGYRGLDDRQATITAYDGATVSIAPVGTNQVRLAEHPNVDWEQLLPLTGPAYLSDGGAFHLGPPGRGVTIEFLECRRLGTWAQEEIRSEAADPDPEIAPSNVKEIRSNRGLPPWFLPGLGFITFASSAAVLVLTFIKARDVKPLVPDYEGQAVFEVAGLDVEINPELQEGFDQAYDYFIQRHNAEAAGAEDYRSNRQYWDTELLDWVSRSAVQHGRAQKFWGRLEAITEDYAYVVKELRRNKLPEVFAAIPYQESRYQNDVQSPVCAKGYWQFMPEVANRLSLNVRQCTLSGIRDDWAPTEKAPPLGVIKNAVYMRNGQCIIPKKGGCKVDERTDLQMSTDAAMRALGEAWEDPEFRESGSAVQMVIASHNAGYNDAKYNGGKTKPNNILPAYQRYIKATGPNYGPFFIGSQITCTDSAAYDNPDKCGSVLHRETQHYPYAIIAQHFLAVCYYATNYSTEYPVFKEWQDFVLGGYCDKIQVPAPEQARMWQ